MQILLEKLSCEEFVEALESFILTFEKVLLK